MMQKLESETSQDPMGCRHSKSHLTSEPNARYLNKFVYAMYNDKVRVGNQHTHHFGTLIFFSDCVGHQKISAIYSWNYFRLCLPYCTEELFLLPSCTGKCLSIVPSSLQPCPPFPISVTISLHSTSEKSIFFMFTCKCEPEMFVIHNVLQAR